MRPYPYFLRAFYIRTMREIGTTGVKRHWVTRVIYFRFSKTSPE